MPFPATKCAAATLLALSTGAAGATLLSDDFNRPNSITVGNGWVETESGAAKVGIGANELHFNSSGTGNRPIAQHAIPEQTSGTVRWTFQFDWVRTGNDNSYEVWMQLGDGGSMTANADSAGVAVNVKWAGPNNGMTNHGGFGHVTGAGTTTTELSVVSGRHAIEILADLDAKTYDLAIDSVTAATGIPFDNDAPINAVRLRIDEVNQGSFDQMAFDDMLVQTVQAGPTIALADHAAGQQADAFSQSGGETDAELLAFRLDPGSDTIAVTRLVFGLDEVAGLSDGDWSGVEIAVDANDNGDIAPGEIARIGGTGVVDTAAGTITFALPFVVSAAGSYILRADFPSLSEGDQITVTLDGSGITTPQSATGSVTPATHLERCYVEKYETWTASSSATWETMDLSVAPYNVPPNAIVEVAAVNTSTSIEQWAGLRRNGPTGSTPDRRFRLNEAESGGQDVLTMHVSADAAARIQHFAGSTSSNQFILLGYWTCGTYVETNDTFSAGSSGAWTGATLAGYGVGPGDVAEIVIANSRDDAQRLAGVRATGSTIERRVDLHEAESGGVDLVTMHVAADTTASAAIEVYAQSDADVSFTLAGYWSVPPRPYTELFVDLGDPAADGTWEDRALASFGVPANTVVEVVLANDDNSSENRMGVRGNGSAADRLLDLQEAESGGVDTARMQAATDDAALIEFLHGDVDDSYQFHLVGYWGVPSVGDLMLVVGDAASPAATDVTRRLAFEAWGWNVTVVDDNATPATMDAAISATDVVYVSSTINANTLAAKLNDVPGGVISEAGDSFDDLEVTNSATGIRTGTAIDVLPVTHYITAPLSGQVSICATPQPLNDIPTSIARGGIALAARPAGSTYALVAIDWCGTRRGRRVLLPWGGAAFDFGKLDAAGQTIIQRSLRWARALMVHWKLDENTGLVAADSGPHGHDAVLVNMSGTEWDAGRVGGAVTLDGSDDHLVAVTFEQPTAACTYAFWFAPEQELTLIDGRQDLLHGVAGPRPHLTFNRQGGGQIGMYVTVNGSDHDDVETVTGIWPAGEWRHVAVTWDGTDFMVYVNCELEAGPITHSGAFTPSVGLTIGRRTGQGNYFQGMLDDIRIYDLALSEDEVDALCTGCGTSRIISWQEEDPLR